MGEVFAAENIRTGRPVAVKLLRADAKEKSSAVARFRREARAAGSINSDHVTEILDVEDDPDHGIVLVFELLEGESLIERLKRTGPIPFDELYVIIEQAWIGLADAHKAGIIHRDLKPSNLFLERRPDGQTRVKILDFGISKLPKEMGGETLTEMGQSLGTFSFMPPEQIGKAKTVDHRADIYACATMIYQALTGQLPYSARNILLLIEMKAKTEGRTLADAMGEPVDARLEAFVAKGLARDPDHRFQSSLEALHAWRDLRPQAPSQVAQPSSPPPPPSIPPPQAAPPPQVPRPATSAQGASHYDAQVPRPAASAQGASLYDLLPRQNEGPSPSRPPMGDEGTAPEPVMRRAPPPPVIMVNEATSDASDAATLAMPVSQFRGEEGDGAGQGPRANQGGGRLHKQRTMPVSPPPSFGAPAPAPTRPRISDRPPPQAREPQAGDQEAQARREDDGGRHGLPAGFSPTQGPRPSPAPSRIDPASSPSVPIPRVYDDRASRPRAPGVPSKASGKLTGVAALKAPQRPEARRLGPIPLVLGAILFALVGFAAVAVVLEYLRTGTFGLP